MNTSVSVIIPTHNRSQLVLRALTSVFAQTCDAFEVIVVDDGSVNNGSGDDTHALITASFPQVHYIYQHQQGVSAARNTGIRNATGEWLAFLDSDDEWLPEKLARQITALKAQPEFKLSHSDEIWIRHGTRVNPMKKHAKQGGWIFPKCLPLCAISPSAVMVHHSVFEKVGLFDESLPACEDYDMWLRICSRYPVLYIDTPLIKKYGGHEDQLSKKYWGMDRFRIQALEKIIQSGTLNEKDRHDALEMLMQKVHIYLQGAKKRSRHDEVEHYESMLARHAGDTPTVEYATP